MNHRRSPGSSTRASLASSATTLAAYRPGAASATVRRRGAGLAGPPQKGRHGRQGWATGRQGGAGDRGRGRGRAAGGRALGLELDVTSAASVRAAVEAAVAQFGGLHILVNNAGIAQRGRLEELSEADWDRLLAVNLKGPFLCSQAAARHLEGGGAIVNVASLAGRSSSPLQGCHYTASQG